MALIDTETTVIDVASPRHGTTSAPAILLVEDEVLLRMVTADHLRALGYMVLEAANASEAIKMLQSTVHIDAVLSDIRMPDERNGVALARWIKTHRPDLPVVLVSGEEPPSISPNEIEAFFAKPYYVDDIVDFIATRLANGPVS